MGIQICSDCMAMAHRDLVVCAACFSCEHDTLQHEAQWLMRRHDFVSVASTRSWITEIWSHVQGRWMKLATQGVAYRFERSDFAHAIGWRWLEGNDPHRLQCSDVRAIPSTEKPNAAPKPEIVENECGH